MYSAYVKKVFICFRHVVFKIILNESSLANRLKYHYSKLKKKFFLVRFYKIILYHILNISIDWVQLQNWFEHYLFNIIDFFEIYVPLKKKSFERKSQEKLFYYLKKEYMKWRTIFFLVTSFSPIWDNLFKKFYWNAGKIEFCFFIIYS